MSFVFLSFLLDFFFFWCFKIIITDNYDYVDGVNKKIFDFCRVCLTYKRYYVCSDFNFFIIE